MHYIEQGVYMVIETDIYYDQENYLYIYIISFKIIFKMIYK